MSEHTETTSKVYWSEFWNRASPRGPTLSYRLLGLLATNRRLDMIFKKHLPARRNRLLEIGCASGRFLVYFHHEFGFQVCGVDYSEEGCKMARDALAREGIRGRVFFDDVFSNSFQKEHGGSFDIVVSFGFLEHFYDPRGAIAIHLNLVRKGGFVIIEVPNYCTRSMYRRLLIAAGREKEVVASHNVQLTELSRLKRHLDQFDLDIRLLDYVGPIDLGAADPRWPKYLWPLHLYNQLLGYLTFWLHSEVFSPSILLIAKKK